MIRYGETGELLNNASTGCV